MVGAPPLRTADDQAALWDGLRSGDVHAIGSDNTSWTPEQKAAGCDDFTKVPYGVPGLEALADTLRECSLRERARRRVTTFVQA